MAKKTIKKKKIGRPPGSIGRPKIDIDWKMVNNLAGIMCTQEEIAGVLQVSIETLSRKSKKEHRMPFVDYLKKHQSNGKASLRRKQFEAALKGNITMLIWLGKQYLDQSDTLTQKLEQTQIYSELQSMSDKEISKRMKGMDMKIKRADKIKAAADAT
jgi:hypothetical protein